MSSRLLPPDSPLSSINASDDDDDDDDLDLSELNPSSANFDASTSHDREHQYRLPRTSLEARRSLDRRRKEERSQTSRIALRNFKPSFGLGSQKRQQPYQDSTDSRILDERRDSQPGKGSEETLQDEDDEAPLLLGSEGKKRSTASKLGISFLIPGRSTPQPTPPSLPSTSQEVVSQSDTRSIFLSRPSTAYPANVISNTKYTPFTFLPLTLYNEFKFFFNLYFLLVALSQIIPQLRIGYLSTYVVPLLGVLAITLGKEAYDDLARRRRDTEANSEEIECMVFTNISKPPSQPLRKMKKRRNHEQEQNENSHTIQIDNESDTGLRGQVIKKKSRDIRVGDILHLRKDQRVPADVVLLKTVPDTSVVLNTQVEEGPAGEAFIRTDQLDGETDWKLRIASPLSQSAKPGELYNLKITAGPPSKAVNQFVGTIEVDGDNERSLPLNIENTAWANTVLASSTPVLAAVIYTGTQTRQALSTSKSRSKSGLLEDEINNLTKILCGLTLTLSILLVVLHNTAPRPTSAKPDPIGESPWYFAILRFLILFSTIVPISLRVNLDMGKTVYARFIEKDAGIEGAIVRTSTIPEELGRVEYLLTDKTGTLTQNDMELKKIHVGTVSYAGDAMDEVSAYVRQGFGSLETGMQRQQSTDTDLLLNTELATKSEHVASGTRSRREIGSRVRDVVLALALAHNVTPTTDESTGETSYQAASPDEIAIVKWTELVGLKLIHRDRKGMKLASVETGKVIVRVRILDIFPFTSEGKRMGTVLQFLHGQETTGTNAQSCSGEIWFFQKGADTVMSKIVASNDWLDEECGNMAREGLRTLVVGRKRLSWEQYSGFQQRYKTASLLLSSNRDNEMQKVVSETLESDLELLGVTGVEDRLQMDVKPSLELLRNAGIRIWMLTGDKVETARCVAVSAKLVGRGQFIYTIEKLRQKDSAYNALEFLRNKTDACLLIDGESLALLLDSYKDTFIALAVQLPAVIACRCSPTQKADIAQLIRTYTKKRICCIGDGGNDVSMIQAADVGVGIVGKEGRQASLAADFSIEQFCHLVKLLLWHGRCSYKRSAKLAQFVIHRGLIVSVCQTMFSIASRFEPLALYQGWLLVGYATLYTMAPVFSLVLDRDIDEALANLYPELYKELTSGDSLSYHTFFVWVFVSIYQGGIIQGLSQLLVNFNATTGSEQNFKHMVSISYTALVLCELCMVAMEVTTWHVYMIFAEVGTAVIFFASWPFLSDYFDLRFLITGGFWWRVAVVIAVAVIPPWVFRVVKRRLRPPNYAKLQGV